MDAQQIRACTRHYIASTQKSTHTQKSEHRTIRKCQHKTANGHEAINSPRQVSGLIPVPAPPDLLYLPALLSLIFLFRQHQPTVLLYTLIQPASVSTDTAGNDNIFPAPYINASDSAGIAQTNCTREQARVIL